MPIVLVKMTTSSFGTDRVILGTSMEVTVYFSAAWTSSISLNPCLYDVLVLSLSICPACCGGGGEFLISQYLISIPYPHRKRFASL